MMMNALSQVSKDTDIGKQMAYMRNYINQLRDEVENDLMNIGYDNLDADLRKRFDDMQTGLLTANNTSIEVAGMLKTQYLKADEIAAKYITAQTVAANYATIGSLNAVSAAIGDLAAIAITTQNLSAQTINANQITAGKIKASQLDADDIASGLFVGEALVATSTAFTLCNSQYFRASGWFSVGNGGQMIFNNSSETDSVYLDYTRVKAILQAI